MRWLRSLVATRSLTILALIVFLWANLPYLVGCWVGDKDAIFSGFFIFEQDGFSYLAKMRQGAEGNWLLHLPYTAQAHQGVLVYAFYLVLGKLAHLLTLPFIATYHLARVVGSGLLLATGARFVAQFTKGNRWQIITWAMLLLGGGVDWLISVGNPEYVAYASVAPDAFLFSLLYGPPHIVLALALMLLALIQVLGCFQPKAPPQRRQEFLWLAASSLLMALSRPEYVAILLAVSGAYWVAMCLSRQQFLWRELIWIGAAELTPLLYALYVYYISKTHPVMAAWAAQNAFTSPSLLNLLAGIGLFMIPGLIGLWNGRWWQDERQLMLVAWVVVLPIMLYLPLSLNRRLIGGALFALAIPAGHWIDERVLPWLGQKNSRRILVGALASGFALVLISYPLLFGLGAIGFVSTQPDSRFLSADEVAALDWLAMQEDGHIVLSAEQTGNRIPAFSSAIPVLGHAVETLNIEKTRVDVDRFYAADTQPSVRKAILAEYAVDLIWWGPQERDLSGTHQLVIPDTQLVYEQDSIQVWSVANAND